MFESAIEIADQTSVGLLMTGKDGLGRYANTGFLELLDLPLEAVLDRSPLDCLPEESHAAFSECLRGGGGPFEAQGLTRSGNRVHVAVRSIPVLAPDGQLQGVISFVTGPDRRAREAGAEAEARMHAALQRAEVSEDLVARTRSMGVWSLLSPREREIAGLLMKGNRPTEIAGALHLSVHTVRNHLRLVYRKLGVHSQIELLARLRESRGA